MSCRFSLGIHLFQVPFHPVRVGCRPAGRSLSRRARAEFSAALNYASSLIELQHFEEAKSLMRKTTPVARRVLGEGHRLTLKMRWVYAQTIYMDAGATLDDRREAVTTLEDAERTARRVFGGAHPLTEGIGEDLERSRAALRAREPPSSGTA